MITPVGKLNNSYHVFCLSANIITRKLSAPVVLHILASVVRTRCDLTKFIMEQAVRNNCALDVRIISLFIAIEVSTRALFVASNKRS